MKVEFKKEFRDGHYTVYAGEKSIGHTRVEKMGWKQFGAVRGTPSQSWSFFADAPFKSLFGIKYLADLKKLVEQEVNK